MQDRFPNLPGPPCDSLPTQQLLGLDFAALDLDRVLRHLLARPAAAPFGYVVTPNADHLVRLAREPGLCHVYAGAELRLLDSRLVQRSARALGLAAPPAVPGSDLTARLLAAVGRSEPVTIVGLPPEWLGPLAARCGIAPPAHHDPPAGFEHDPQAFARAVRFVLDHPARFVLLAVGAPRQERLAAAIAATGQARGLGLCIGASLDFLSGRARRAPRWMQHTGIEWLHRLGSEPRRLAGRYLRDDPAIFALLLRERLAAS